MCGGRKPEGQRRGRAGTPTLSARCQGFPYTPGCRPHSCAHGLPGCRGDPMPPASLGLQGAPVTERCQVPASPLCLDLLDSGGLGHECSDGGLAEKATSGSLPHKVPCPWRFPEQASMAAGVTWERAWAELPACRGCQARRRAGRPDPSPAGHLPGTGRSMTSQVGLAPPACPPPCCAATCSGA